MTYNADGRRTLKQSSDYTYYFWDPVFDTYLLRYQAGGALSASLYTNEPVQFGRIITEHRLLGTGSGTNILHTDALGSVRAITNSAQTTLNTYAYSAWGSDVVAVESIPNEFRWVGIYGYCHDSVLGGQYYIRARVYQPSIARWTSVDPLFYLLARSGIIGLGSKDPIGYLYVGAGPIIRRDPSGRYTISDAENDYCNLDGPCTSLVGAEKSDCFRDCVADRKDEIFERWVLMEGELGPWWADVGLPKCPARLCVRAGLWGTRVRNPSPDGFFPPGRIGYHEGRFHPGGYFSMRSHPIAGHSNQCVYGKDGWLIRSWPGAGSVDSYAPGRGITAPLSPHVAHDVNPVVYAAKLDGCWQEALVFGHIKPNCFGPNMALYFGVRPLWAEPASTAVDDSDCCAIWYYPVGGYPPKHPAFQPW